MENQRVRLSKTMLKNALVQLLQEKPLDKVSVLEICQTAEINRTTFYKYYGSQTDLLEEIESDFLGQLDEKIGLVLRNSTDAITDVLGSLYEQRSVFCTLVRAVPGQQFAAHLLALPSLNAIFQNLEVSEGYEEHQAKYVRRFISQGTFAVLCDWLGSDDPEPLDEIAAVLETMRGRF